MQKMHRVQSIAIPILREGFANSEYADLDIKVGSWVPAQADRPDFWINVRRMGGYPVDPKMLDRAVIELTCYGDITYGLELTENVHLEAQIILWDAVRTAKVVAGKGSLSSYRQTMGPTQFDSPYDDKFRVQSLIQLGVRPLPN